MRDFGKEKRIVPQIPGDFPSEVVGRRGSIPMWLVQWPSNNLMDIIRCEGLVLQHQILRTERIPPVIRYYYISPDLSQTN